MIKLFNLNFYCTNVNQLVSSITNNCLVCSLYKSPHKRRISGDERSHQEMKPGKNLSMDICYMNRSARNHKYLLVLTDILTGYVVSYPMTKLDSEETSKKLVQYISHFPVPSTILCDGAHEFSGHFLQTATNYGIMIRTPVPRRSQVQGSVEKAIKDYKNLMTKLISRRGRENWDLTVPICTQIFNSRTPYNLQLSKASLFLGPLFHVKFFYLFSNAHDLEELLKIQNLTLNKLSSKRRKSLIDLSRKIKNVKSNLLEGSIVTDEMNSEDLETVEGSRALLPTSRNIYKIVAIQENKIAARIRNLQTGKEHIRSLEHLRKLNFSDIPLLNINDRNLFKEFPDARQNILNLKVAPSQEPDTLSTSQARIVTRSQTSSFRSSTTRMLKSALKKRKYEYGFHEFINNTDPNGLLAIKRALKLKLELDNKLSTLQQRMYKAKPASGIEKYTIQNETLVSRSPKRVKIQAENEAEEKQDSYEGLSFYNSILESDMSGKELKLLLL